MAGKGTATTEHSGLADDAAVVRSARALINAEVVKLGYDALDGDAALIGTELVTNALLHGGGCRGVEVAEVPNGLRIAVRDYSKVPPVLGHASEDSLTGRGLRVVATLGSDWGTEVEPDGKVVWADITLDHGDMHIDLQEAELLARWEDDWDAEADGPRYRVELGDVPTHLLLSAKSHVDGIAREFALASAGAESGLTREVPAHLADLLRDVVERFAEARLAIKHQALEAHRRGDETTKLVLHLPASAADAAEQYVEALDEVDAYSRAKRLLTLETPPQHVVFRHWYVEEVVEQLRAAAAGVVTRPPVSFNNRLLSELDRLTDTQRAFERAARLYTLATALATADTPEAVANAVLEEGVAALDASGGGLLLATQADRLSLPGAIGYDETVVARLREESRDAELPAAVALRTGEAVWLESQGERDRRFPELVGLEVNTIALCAVPLEVQGRRLGALRFSFNDARLFDEDERRFVMALAAQSAQALDRAQLQHARLDVSHRLQRSLLPPQLPEVSGLDVAALYHPFGDGLDVGGDFYDFWELGNERWAIAIGDATGTGPEAAALTALVRSTGRALARMDLTPQEVVAGLNVALLEAGGEERFCTGMFGIVRRGDPFTIDLSGGGHPPAFLRRAAGTIERVSGGGALLGSFADADVGHAQVDLAAGDVLVLLTDGVLEARGADGVMFDQAGVERVLTDQRETAMDVIRALEYAVLQHTGGKLSDDMAVIVLQVRATG